MPSQSPKEVLVVEDEPLVRMAAADVLVDNGIMAWEAADALDALDVLEAHPRIALVFTDINMPGDLDGLGLAKEVNVRWPEVELIITSGAVNVPDIDLPDDGIFLPKPYSPEKLVEVVEEKLSRPA